MKKYRLTPKAEADLRHIWQYTVTKWGSEQAEKYFQDIEICLQKICADEWKAKDCSVLLNKSERSILYYLVGSHYLILREKEGGYDVLSVLHKQMNLEKHLDNL